MVTQNMLFEEPALSGAPLNIKCQELKYGQEMLLGKKTSKHITSPRKVGISCASD